jgi:hypothetical protein
VAPNPAVRLADAAKNILGIVSVVLAFEMFLFDVMTLGCIRTTIRTSKYSMFVSVHVSVWMIYFCQPITHAVDLIKWNVVWVLVKLVL